MPATLTQTFFVVDWSGTDDLGGSGIAGYDIYVSIDDALFTVWLSGTTLTSAVYTGEADHTYGFFSIGTDNVGHREPTPTIAQATIRVIVSNSAPVLLPIGNQTADEGIGLTFTVAAADLDIPAQTLTYSLIGATYGASIHPQTGVFTWTPTETQGPGSFTLIIRVTDSGTPGLFDEEELTITVDEVNQAPVLAVIGNKTIDQGALLTFVASASDADLPTNGLTFSLIGGPAGASIDPATGLFGWTPTEAQDGSYSMTIRVTDNGTGLLYDEESITVIVGEVNTPPILEPIQIPTSIDEGETLTFVASGHDSDLVSGVPNYLTYSLINAPVGASIDQLTGVFRWAPSESQDGSYTFIVRVTDNGAGDLYAERTITVTVNEVNVAPILDDIGYPASFDEGTALTYSAVGRDFDVVSGLPNNLSYSLIEAPPGQASIRFRGSSFGHRRKRRTAPIR